MILLEQLKEAARTFVKEHYTNPTELEVQLILGAMLRASNLALEYAAHIQEIQEKG